MGPVVSKEFGNSVQGFDRVGFLYGMTIKESALESDSCRLLPTFICRNTVIAIGAKLQSPL